MNKSFIDGDAGSVPWDFTSVAPLYDPMYPISDHYGRLRYMAAALLYPGKFHMDTELYNVIISAMRWLLNNAWSGCIHQNSKLARGLIEHYYPNPADRQRLLTAGVLHTSNGNWWHYDIGFSKHSIPVLIMLWDLGFPRDLAGEYLKRIHIWNACPTERVSQDNKNPGAANRADKAFSIILHGILSKDEERVRQGAAEAFTDTTVPLASGGDGYYPDGSFIEHNVYPYALGYGLAALDTFSRILNLLGGESIGGVTIEFNKKYLDRLMDVLGKTYLTAAWRGAAIPNLGGRGISRADAPEMWVKSLAYTLIGLIPVMSEDMQRETRACIRSWIEHTPSLAKSDNIGHNARLARFYAETVSMGISPHEQTGIFAQNNQSRTHLRADKFAFSIAYNNFNANTAPFQAGNNENMLAVHSGDGMTYLFLENDQQQYIQPYFITADYHHLPGVTADILPGFDFSHGGHNSPHTGKNSRNILGGTTVLTDAEGQYAATAFLKDNGGSSPAGMDSNTTVNQSWFMPGDYIVALGSNINNNQGRAVDTAIDQRRLRKGIDSFIFNDVSVNGFSSDYITTSSSWAHLSYRGTHGPARVGYFIPEAGRKLSMGIRKMNRNAKEVNKGNQDKIFTADYANIILHHGSNPVDGLYEYAVLPNRGREQVRAFASRQGSDTPLYTVTAHERTLHAVYDHDVNVLAINNLAREPACVTSPGTGITYRVSTAGIVIIREHKNGQINMGIHCPMGDLLSVSISLT
jgi:hyaluronate lyase